MRPFIHKVVESFYTQVIPDVLIGYHFRKFEDPEVLSHHLERLASFWEMQLMQTLTVPLEKPFSLIYTHFQLNLKNPGELGRWVTLFNQTLDEYEKKTSNPQELAIIEIWRIKIEFFKNKFLSVPGLFQKTNL